jgi:hypothetical protein
VAGAEKSLRFERDEVGAGDLQAVIDEVVAELEDPASKASKQAEEAGIEAGELSGVDVSVKEDKQGFEPILTTILVTIAADVGKEVVVDKLWAKVLWPRIKRRFGPKAIGKKLP